MSRKVRIAAIAGGSVAALLLVLVVAGIVVVQTQWFRDFVRQKIITSVEEATGGRAEIGSFAFDWHRLRAEVRGFVLHGLEPAGTPPLFRARLLQVDLKLLSPFKGMVDIAALLLDTPQANVIVFPDGHTNIPAPKLTKPSDKSGLETVVNLAVGKFDLRSGSLILDQRKIDFHATGQNLHTHLDYNPLQSAYSGEVDMSPLYLQTGNGQRLDVDVKLPVKLEKDKISLASAQLTTPASQIVVSGSMENMLAPRYNAHLNARVSLEEIARTRVANLRLDTARGPGVLSADITAKADKNRTRIESARLSLGGSNLEASGILADTRQAGAVQFNLTLALAEIGRLLRVAAQPQGVLRAGGTATLPANDQYQVRAKVEARNVSFRQGTTALAGIQLNSNLLADPRLVELSNLRLAALGGAFTGSASLANMHQFQLSGNLRNFDIAALSRTLMQQPLDYAGEISGPVQAQADLKNISALVAHASLAITPGKKGIPVSGRLAADYNGRADTVTLAPSYVALPHTRIDLSGSLGRQISVRLVSRDFSDFRPVAAVPVTFANGAAVLNATVSGKLSAPQIAGHVNLSNFAVEGRPFARFDGDLSASPIRAALTNASVTRGSLQMQASASVGLRNWKATPAMPLRVDATVRNADLRDVLALAGQAEVAATGVLTADAHVDGTLGSPRGTADLAVVNGTILGGPFDRVAANATMSERSIDIPTLQWTAGPSRVDANASYQHGINDLERGSLRVHVTSNQVQVAQFQSLVKDRPGLRGVLALNGDAVLNVAPAATGTDIQITSVNANFSARGFEMQGKSLGDLTASANTSGTTLQYNVTSDFAGSTIHVNGQSLLAGNHQTTATATIANLPVDQVLAVAGRHDLPIQGTLSVDAQLSGTTQDPRARGSFSITRGSAYGEPFDRLETTVDYSNQLIDISSLRLVAGPSNLELSASLAHPAGDLQNGHVRFQVRSNQVQLDRIRTLVQFKPGVSGTVQLNADGDGTLRRGQAPLFSMLNANVATHGLSVNHKPVGDITATAETQGSELNFTARSDFGHSNINGSGRMQLAGEYPLNAQVKFSNVTYSGLSNWIGAAVPPGFDASTEGEITVAGPVTRVDAMRASLQVTKLEAHSTAPSNGRKPRANIELHNEGPIVVALDRSVVTIQSARISGPYANLSLAGSASLGNVKNLNLRADGNVKLEMLEAFDPGIFSSGSVSLNAAVTGTTAQPAVNGRLQLQNASFNMLSLPNGLSNANGTVTFNGTQAFIQNITGETGGGKITLAGTVSYGGPEMQFRVQANANNVRVSYPDTVTTEASAQLTLAGTSSRSALSGNVTILDVALHSHSDIGSMLAQAATPPASPAASSGILSGIRFDVRIQTAPDVQFRTALTQNLEADANLTLRGSIDHPGMLGRIVITQGDVVFFGSKYTIDQGSISFFNPSKINPTLNIDLETTAAGVDVSLSVTGPMDRLKLSYRSDPPLQFSDIVALLASGKPPTTDPVLAARQAPAPQQSFEQVGASTLLGQAVANPVSGRLQRLFGVSRLKIDPMITGASNTPQATVTLQQQITRDLTFTYSQDVSQANPQTLRIEWTIDPRLSAIAQRDLNGQVDVDFYYKKRFW